MSSVRLLARALGPMGPLLVSTLATLGCVTQPGPAPAEAGAQLPASAAIATASPGAGAATGAAPTPTQASTAAGESLDAGAAAPPAGSASPSAGASAAPAAPAAETPAVRVENIGMHIGGGPNDAATKAPVKRSMEPHFDALQRCFARVDDQAKAGDFGVDLLIPAAGGKAKVTHPRTALRGEGFSPCVVQVFANAVFEKPTGGLTMVSYSLRFTPDKR